MTDYKLFSKNQRVNNYETAKMVKRLEGMPVKKQILRSLHCIKLQ